MSSYNSISGRRFFPASNAGGEDDAAGSPMRAVSERTPLLLSLPPNPYQQRPVAVSGEQEVDSDSATEIVGEDEELGPLLSRVNSTCTYPLGVEAETIPPLGNSPGEHGDFRLPEDDELRLQTVKEDAEEDVDKQAGSQISFHGGISAKRFWIIFTAILIANFVAAADATLLASTHTIITSAFKSSNSASWLSTSFLLTSTSFQPLYGRLSDVLGRKIPFVFACLVFTIATVWCAIAGSIGSFIAARAVCGLGAGGMLSMGSIILSDMLPIEIRGTYQSINNLAYGMGSALGAATGGGIADALGWRWEFGIQVPFSLFCVAVCAIAIPNPEHLGENIEANFWNRFRNFDLAGSFYLTTSVAFLILGMNLGGNVLEWTDWRIISFLVIGFILAYLLVRAETKAISPVMPLKFLREYPLSNLIFSNFLGCVTINTLIFNLPLYFQAVRLESATTAGMRLLVPSLSGTFASVSTGLIITRYGRLEPTLYFGCLFLTIGTIMFCFMERNFADWMFFIFLVPANLGLGFSHPSTLMSVLAVSSQQEQAVATSTLIMWRSLGSVLGVASSSLIVQNCLYYFLKINVSDGPMKEKVIAMVRSSVTAIHELPSMYQEQVIASYVSSLRCCFVWGVLTGLISFALIIGIKLPRLRKTASEATMKEALISGE